MFKEKCKRIIKDFLGLLFFNNLKVLAHIYKTDKRGHDYLENYQRHFSSLRFARINLLEIGIGGYDDPKAGGNSLRMWKKFFPFGRVHGIDIVDKSALAERRIQIHQGSQTDLSFLETMIGKVLPVTIIIDDGSHVSKDVITTFKFLFPKLRKRGMVCRGRHSNFLLEGIRRRPQRPCQSSHLHELFQANYGLRQFIRI